MNRQIMCITLMLLLITNISIILAENDIKSSLKPKPAFIPNQGEGSSPASWENFQGIPPVGNQVVAGSCYAWAAAYYYLTHLQYQEYGWDVTDPAHQCSPAFVYNLTNGGGR